MDNSGGHSANVSASLAGRYATALFALATEKKSVAAVEGNLTKLVAAVNESDDFRALTTNPSLSRAATKSAIAAVAKVMKLDTLTANTLGVLAENRRLGEIGAMARAFATLASHDRGEITAEVTSVRPLSAAQNKALAAQLKQRVGKDVSIKAIVDPSILGGLTVTIGSQMIDSSIRTRLNSLAQAMKG